MTTDCQIRFASVDDVPMIMKFIHELADYEKLSHEVKGTEATLRESLFGVKSHAEVIISEYNEIPVGFALFFHNFSTFLGRSGIYLEDLYIKPEMRGRGIGKKMLATLAKLAKERNCGRLEWSVLDWNQPAIDFYNSIDAKPMRDWTAYRLDGQALVNLANQFEEKVVQK